MHQDYEKLLTELPISIFRKIPDFLKMTATEKNFIVINCYGQNPFPFFCSKECGNNWNNQRENILQQHRITSCAICRKKVNDPLIIGITDKYCCWIDYPEIRFDRDPESIRLRFREFRKNIDFEKNSHTKILKSTIRSLSDELAKFGKKKFICISTIEVEYRRILYLLEAVHSSKKPKKEVDLILWHQKKLTKKLEALTLLEKIGLGKGIKLIEKTSPRAAIKGEVPVLDQSQIEKCNKFCGFCKYLSRFEASVVHILITDESFRTQLARLLLFSECGNNFSSYSIFRFEIDSTGIENHIFQQLGFYSLPFEFPSQSDLSLSEIYRQFDTLTLELKRFRNSILFLFLNICASEPLPETADFLIEGGKIIILLEGLGWLPNPSKWRPWLARWQGRWTAALKRLDLLDWNPDCHDPPAEFHIFRGYIELFGASKITDMMFENFRIDDFFLLLLKLHFWTIYKIISEKEQLGSCNPWQNPSEITFASVAEDLIPGNNPVRRKIYSETLNFFGWTSCDENSCTSPTMQCPISLYSELEKKRLYRENSSLNLNI